MIGLDLIPLNQIKYHLRILQKKFINTIKKPQHFKNCWGSFTSSNYLKSATTVILGLVATFPAAMAPPFTP